MEGPAAWDFWTAFEQHWRHQLSEHVDELLRLDQVRSCTIQRCSISRGSAAVHAASLGCSCGALQSFAKGGAAAGAHFKGPAGVSL